MRNVIKLLVPITISDCSEWVHKNVRGLVITLKKQMSISTKRNWLR